MDNHLSDVEFKEFMSLYKKCTAKPYSFLIFGTTVAWDNPLRFEKESSRKNIKSNHYNWW